MAIQNDFVPGLDITPLASVAKADLIQMLTGMIPTGDGTQGGIGGIVVMAGDGGSPSSARPDIVNNPRFVRYIWIDTYTPANPILKYWAGTYDSSNVPIDLAASWVSYAVPNDSITTAMLKSGANAAVALSTQIKGQAADAGKVVCVDGASPYNLQTRTIDAILSDLPNVVPLAAIDKTGAMTSGILYYNGSSLVFGTVDTLISGATILPITKITAGSTENQVLSAGPAATFTAQWKGHDYGAAINAGTYGGQAQAKIAIASISNSSITKGDTIVFDGTNWVKKTTGFVMSNSVFSGVDAGAVAVSTTYTFTHGLKDATGADKVPVMVRAVLYCNTIDVGYAVGDEIDISSVIGYVSDQETAPLFSVVANDTTVKVISPTNYYGSAITAIGVIHKTTAATGYTSITGARWNVKVYAWA